MVIKGSPSRRLSLPRKFLIDLPSMISSPSVMLQAKVQVLQDILPVRLTFFLPL